MRDEWLRAGDAGRLDDEGYLYIEDRVKHLYISSGENVYPAEVERVILELDPVLEAAEVGVWSREAPAVSVNCLRALVRGSGR
jgi:acyl-CoA synthetase (AMP-forming)/AMP-acid ligase II